MLFNNSRNVHPVPPTHNAVPAKTTPTADVPEVNPEAWALAEAAVRNKNGGFAGVGPEGKRAQIQAMYDQLDETNRKAAAFQ